VWIKVQLEKLGMPVGIFMSFGWHNGPFCPILYRFALDQISFDKRLSDAMAGGIVSKNQKLEEQTNHFNSTVYCDGV